MAIDKTEIAALTEEYGGQWGINHTKRLLQLIAIIGEGLQYDPEAVWIAAHLHDWGGYGKWAQKDVDHAERSFQVAGEFLKERGCEPAMQQKILECIRLHHKGGAEGNVESQLLSDADALDFLGVVGVLRDFSKNTKDMRKAYDTARRRRATLPDALRLPRSRDLASERIPQMDELLERFKRDSFGCF
jgi:HD superfamily phosphodiesterase